MDLLQEDAKKAKQDEAGCSDPGCHCEPPSEEEGGHGSNQWILMVIDG